MVLRTHRIRAVLVTASAALSMTAIVALSSPPEASAAATQVAAGYDHSCALLPGGTVRCWGANGSGQLGDGSTVASTTPVSVRGLAGAKFIVAGWQSSCALLEDSTVKCWGRNDKGQLGDGTFIDRNSAVPVYGLSGVTGISTGWQHTCVVVTGGTVKCWGRNDSTQLGFVTRIAPFAENKPHGVTGLTGVTKVAVGYAHSCALREAKTVSCWGLNSAGQLGDSLQIVRDSFRATPRTVMDRSVALSNVVDLASGLGSHTCAVLSSQSVRCWGVNSNGQLGDGTRTDSSTPLEVTGLVGAVALDLGYSHSCAAAANGSTSCWGWNGSGQIGDGTLVDRLTPTQVPGLASTTTLGAGFAHSCALVDGGRVDCWGRNQFGQLGNGTTSNSPAPSSVPNLVDPPTVTGSPPSQTNLTKTTVSFEGDPGASFECSLESAAFNPCSSPVDLADLGVGAHSFKVRQVTPEGTSNSTALAWTIDLTPPAAPRLTGVPATLTNSRSASIGLVGETGGIFTCSVDSAPAVPCTTPLVVRNLTDGPHTVSVQQTDAAGNPGSATTVGWTVDTLGPVLTGKVVAGRSGHNTIIRTTFNPSLGTPAKLEWSTVRSRPSSSAAPAHGHVLRWSSRLTVVNVTGITWVRVGDSIGNWSSWVKVG